MEKTIVILCTLDTKWKETEFLKSVILKRGHKVIIVDVSLGGDAPLPGDISPAEIAKAGGSDITTVRKLSPKARGEASQIMTKGSIVKAKELRGAGKLDGIIGIGGNSNTAMATNVMKSLPFGIPKFMVSSAASMPAYAAGFIGTSDITMMHSVVDIAGTNDLNLDVLTRAAGAISGMVETGGAILAKAGKKREKPLIALTRFNFCETAAKIAMNYLEEKGFDVIGIHAQGIGDRAMEELIEQGLFDGVLDFVLGGVSENIIGGNRDAGPTRLEAAGNVGIPQVVSPCGFEMISCGPLSRRDRGDLLWTSRKLAERKLFLQDDFRVQARTTKEELRDIAVTVARKLNKAKGPVKFLIPLRGWSTLTTEGGPLYEPATDKIFSEEIKKHLRPEIDLKELDVELNSAEFAKACVDALEEMMS
ncbi:MAG: Tm-1-like ATP-binding domain-containing protein [Syntrophobacterales bacterium]|nr:MAG: Tm-1-like ATP-binding domain-containing protein [Syntrophobacterales bacterium]